MCSTTKKSGRSGLSLIETLVVIAIVAVLLGLLGAAIQRIRQAGNRVSCQNNLRQLGMALAGFESQKGLFPRTKLNEEHTLLGHSWAVDLLPFLEQEALYRRFDLRREGNESPNVEAAGVPLRVFQCPAAENPRLVEYGWALGRDVANALATTDYVPTLFVLVESAPGKVSAQPGLLDSSSNVRAADVRDGLSNTIAFTEDAGRDQAWRQGRLVASPHPVPSAAWIDPGNAIVVTGSREQNMVNFTNNDEIYAFHSEGAYAVMADGSVRLLSTSASFRLIVALITRAGGEAVPPD